MPGRSTITVDAPACAAPSPKLPSGYTYMLSILVMLPRTFVKAGRVFEQGNRVKNCVCRDVRSRSANFARLMHMAHSLARKAPGKDSLSLKRKTARRNGEFLASLGAARLFDPFPKKSNDR
jgi:hypothetical protein